MFNNLNSWTFCFIWERRVWFLFEIWFQVQVPFCDELTQIWSIVDVWLQIWRGNRFGYFHLLQFRFQTLNHRFGFGWFLSAWCQWSNWVSIFWLFVRAGIGVLLIGSINNWFVGGRWPLRRMLTWLVPFKPLDLEGSEQRQRKLHRETLKEEEEETFDDENGWRRYESGRLAETASSRAWRPDQHRL